VDVTLRLAEVLELDAVQRAAPEVVVGADLLDRPVRWVHTSELAEAALLLKGGELMLTTGLGIGGRGPVGEAAYVAALAEHGAAHWNLAGRTSNRLRRWSRQLGSTPSR
jgi:purine catabolism regulator